jgi:hypothetical protein
MNVPRIDVGMPTDIPIEDDDVSASEGWLRNRRSKLTHLRTRRLERDAARGYSINVKQVVLAFAVEFWIIGLIVLGTYLLIAESASEHVSREAVFSALLLPAALAMVELARVPLALAVRTQDVWHIKFFAAAGVVAAIVVTSFSLSQIAWKTFDIRIAEATRANDKLAEVKKRRDDFQNKVDQLARDIEQKINVRNSVNERVAALEQQISKISSASGNSCKPVLGPDGHPVIGADGRTVQQCVPIATVNQAQLNTLKAQLTSTKKELEVAESALKQAREDMKGLDRRPIEDELAKAEANYRAAVNKSQLHSYTSMITGKAVAEVTEAEVKNLEKYLIIIPSIAAAFASTLIAITAVRRIKPPEPAPLTTIPDEAAAYLFGPLLAAIKTEARDAVAAAINGRAEATAPPENATA